MTTYYGGWAMLENAEEESVRIKEASKKLNRAKDLEDFTKYPRYLRVEFEGRLQPGSKVTEFEILAWADGGNLCFGGKCEIIGRNFKGSYNID